VTIQARSRGSRSHSEPRSIFSTKRISKSRRACAGCLAPAVCFVQHRTTFCCPSRLILPATQHSHRKSKRFSASCFRHRRSFVQSEKCKGLRGKAVGRDLCLDHILPLVSCGFNRPGPSPFSFVLPAFTPNRRPPGQKSRPHSDWLKRSPPLLTISGAQSVRSTLQGAHNDLFDGLGFQRSWSASADSDVIDYGQHVAPKSSVNSTFEDRGTVSTGRISTTPWQRPIKCAIRSAAISAGFLSRLVREAPSYTHREPASALHRHSKTLRSLLFRGLAGVASPQTKQD